jgi:ABC-type tungstate transport system permease subunit
MKKPNEMNLAQSFEQITELSIDIVGKSETSGTENHMHHDA